MPVLPQEVFQRIRRIQIQTTREVEDLFAGAYRSAFKGKGLEFEDVREYQPGDEIRRIDWNVTARMQRPFIKNFREERELTVILIVDVSASARFSSGERLRSEMIAELGAVLAFSAIKNQDKVGLLLFSNEIELYLSPKKGTRHVLRVIRELLFFQPQHKGTDIQKALTFLGQVQKRSAICFLISDFLANTEQFEHESNLIAKRHELVFIQIYDPYERAFPNLGLAHIKDLESDHMQLIDTSHPPVKQYLENKAIEQQQILTELTQRIRAYLISISSHESYIPALRKFFKRREQRR